MRKASVFSVLAGGALAGAWLLKGQLEKLVPPVPDVNDDTVLLFQFKYSPFCVKVGYILAYKRIPYQTVELAPLLHCSFSRQQSGQVKVPYIRHRGRVIHDSSRIALYLEKEYPQPALIPADTAQREQVLLLEDWFDEALVPALSRPLYVRSALDPTPLMTNPTLNTGIPLLDHLKPYIIPILLRHNMRLQGLKPQDLPLLEERTHEVLARIKALLKREYLVGEQLSLADLTLAAHLYHAEQLPLLSQNEAYRWLLEWRERRLAEILPA